jgi:hypothetical protein
MTNRTYYRGMRVADLAHIIGQCERTYGGDYLHMRAAYETHLCNEHVINSKRGEVNIRRQISVIDYLREEHRRGHRYSVKDGVIRRASATSANGASEQVATIHSQDAPRP